MTTKTDTQTQTAKRGPAAYKGGSLRRIPAQWVAEWMKRKGVALPSGWSSIWNMDAETVAEKYGFKVDEIISAARGEKR